MVEKLYHFFTLNRYQPKNIYLRCAFESILMISIMRFYFYSIELIKKLTNSKNDDFYLMSKIFETLICIYMLNQAKLSKKNHMGMIN